MSMATVRLRSRWARLQQGWASRIDAIQPLFAVALRLHVSWVFLMAGLSKMRDWEVTLALFTNDYHVPLLTPPVAAALAAGTELTLPLLLIVGRHSRMVAVGLFAFNAIAVISYPDLSAAGVKDHVLWGALLLVLAIYGPGPLSLDAWLARRGARRA